jgi:hypothetical protein
MSFGGWAAAGDATQSADVEAAVIDAVMAREAEATGAAMHVEQSAAVAAVMARIPDTGAYKFEAELVPCRAFEARASTVALGFVSLFCTHHYMPKMAGSPSDVDDKTTINSMEDAGEVDSRVPPSAVGSPESDLDEEDSAERLQQPQFSDGQLLRSGPVIPEPSLGPATGREGGAELRPENQRDLALVQLVTGEPRPNREKRKESKHIFSSENQPVRHARAYAPHATCEPFCAWLRALWLPESYMAHLY